MKLIVIIILFLLSPSLSAQTSNLNVGEVWPYSNSYVRTTPDSFQLYKFNYNQGLAKVTYNKKIGFIDSNKTIVIPLVYEYGLGANIFINSRSIVIKNGYWGVIDTLGNEVIPFIYGKIRNRDSLYCVYEFNGYKWGYVDRFGNTLLPMRNYQRSSIMTRKEILELANKHSKNEKLEKSVPISKEKAIKIANKKGYYWDGEFPFIAIVKLDTSLNQWVIISSKYDGVTYEDGCAKANGCFITQYATIVINSNNGKIIKKSKYQRLTPNYE